MVTLYCEWTKECACKCTEHGVTVNLDSRLIRTLKGRKQKYAQTNNLVISKVQFTLPARGQIRTMTCVVLVWLNGLFTQKQCYRKCFCPSSMMVISHFSLSKFEACITNVPQRPRVLDKGRVFEERKNSKQRITSTEKMPLGKKS